MRIDTDPSHRPHPGSDPSRPKNIVERESLITAHYRERLDPGTVEVIVDEHTRLMQGASIQDFGPILLEKQLKQQLQSGAQCIEKKPTEAVTIPHAPTTRETASHPRITRLFRRAR